MFKCRSLKECFLALGFRSPTRTPRWLIGKRPRPLRLAENVSREFVFSSEVLADASKNSRLLQVALVLVRVDHGQKAARFSEACGFYWRISQPRRLTIQPLRDQPHANCLRLRKQHARERRV
jgi:hypothetical protein